jgi:hypothetical protein
MKINIDQDELCESCDKDRNFCEGSACDTARDNYMEDHGLVDDSSCFGDLDAGDVVYRISENIPKIQILDIVKISKSKTDCRIHCKAPYTKNKDGATYDYIVDRSVDHFDNTNVLLLTSCKSKAITRYKKLLTDTMLLMANELNTITR